MEIFLVMLASEGFGIRLHAKPAFSALSFCHCRCECSSIGLENKAMDDHKADLSGAFYIGQSVRCNIVDIARLQSLGSDGFDLKWIEGFNIGSVIEAKIGEAKDIGVVVSFDKYNDVLGFITHSQLMHLLGYIIEGCCHH
ncbi:hypothetical protein E1A91_D05G295600v1 [Gossypium mustelinum]|uniref:S1 motif domain-containing protein n=3 Tax=Gossypium TaxID=3633 RepID=A0A5D2V2A4_GOSMU|nr:hypothetical protein E1A91_D05G295600v1 [Gossypium mustelinum]